tara:strand:+ start:5090 stop:7519 length:2430 start_codon:yes stop_codon:yes gene_type:complete
MALSTYVWFALDLFKKDKAASTYETALRQSQSLTEFVDNVINSNFIVVKSIISNVRSQQVKNAKELFLDQDKIIQIRTFNQEKKEVVNLVSNRFLNENNILKQEIESVDDDLYENTKPLLRIKELGELKILHLSYYDKEAKQYITAKINTNEVQKFFGQNKQFKSFLYFSKDNILSSKGASVELFDQEELKALYKESIDKVITKKLNEEVNITGISTSYRNNFISVSYIKEREAFRAADFLINKSLMFGLLVFSISVIGGVFFSRKITIQLQALSDKTILFAQGNFDESVDVSGKDEIGALADSFNYMSGEIKRYLGEMEEKARMENEIAVAKLVQDKFFPDEHIVNTFGEIASFYTPASECGGDWWGTFDYKEKTLIIIADATGHGVPAALLTATAHCCMTNYENSLHVLNSDSIDINNFMNQLNNAVCSIGGDILMTCFSVLVDHRTGAIEYCNASHNPPLLFDTTKEIDKKEILPLMGEVGPRIGEKLSAQYPVNEVQLEKEQALLLYTDGITEIENDEKKQFGQRRFLKSIAQYNQLGLKEQRDRLVREAFEFSGDVGNDDDVTLILLKRGSHDTEKSEDIMILNDNDNYLDLLTMFKGSSLSAVIGNNSNLIELEKSLVGNEIKVDTLAGANTIQNTLEINDSKNINEKLTELLNQLNFEDYFSECKNILFQVGNELLVNAFYHSSEETSSQSRKESIELQNDKISFSLFQGDHGVGIVVEDFSGKLSKEVTVDSLIRAVKEKTPEDKDGGAGLGLYLSLNKSNILVFDVTEGSSTRVISFIEKTKRTKNYLNRNTSIHMRFGG